MMRRHAPLPLLLGSVAVAQQFPFYQYPYDTLGLSAACTEALNTSTTCSDLLGTHTDFDTASVDIFSEDALTAICVDSCRTELLDIKNAALKACTAEDVMVYSGFAWPATFMLDKYIYTYDISCYKDRVTGDFCDLEIASWRNETSSTNSSTGISHACDDCYLGPLVIQLEHPVASNSEYASQFISLASSCSATGYTYTTGSPYPVTTLSSGSNTVITDNATQPTGTVAPEVPCTSSYTIQSGDSCQSIAAAQNVSQYSITYLNGLDKFCSDLPQPGKSICLPPQCPVHYLSYSDMCSALIAQYGVDTTQFFSWNPNLDRRCINLDSWRQTYICVGPPGGATPEAPTITGTVAPVPTDAEPTSNKDCSSWHLVVSGDTCFDIAKDSDISLADFYFLNPGLNVNCTNLELKVSYCVKAVGSISTYPGYPQTTPTASFTRPPVTTTPGYELPQPTLNPKASGTLPDCSKYQNYVDTSILDSQFGINVSNLTVNQCLYIANKYAVNVTALQSWNPSLDRDPNACALQPGYSYCVVKDEASQSGTPSGDVSSATSGSSSSASTPNTSSPVTSSAASTASTAPPAASIEPGTISTCKKYHEVVSGDTCWALSQEYGFSLDDFYSWNPTVGGSACSGLWLGYYVCVGI